MGMGTTNLTFWDRRKKEEEEEEETRRKRVLAEELARGVKDKRARA